MQDSLTIERRIAQGYVDLVERLLFVTQSGGLIDTAFIERLNATFRQRLACLVRRGRALAHQLETLESGMYLVGGVYYFCTHHKSPRIPLWIYDRSASGGNGYKIGDKTQTGTLERYVFI